MLFKRNRILYSVLIVLVVVLGLSSRAYSKKLPYWIGEYAGDSLWALMVFLMFGFFLITMETKRVAFLTFLFSFTIEVSQLYHAHWIDTIRKTKLGGLILGFGFLWNDLFCYIVGIVIGIIIEKIVFYKLTKRKSLEKYVENTNTNVERIQKE